MARVTASGRLDSFPFDSLLLLFHFMEDTVFKHHSIHLNLYLQNSFQKLLGGLRLLLQLGFSGCLIVLLYNSCFKEKFLKMLHLDIGIFPMVSPFPFLSLQIFLDAPNIPSHDHPHVFWAASMNFFAGVQSNKRRENISEHN